MHRLHFFPSLRESNNWKAVDLYGSSCSHENNLHQRAERVAYWNRGGHSKCNAATAPRNRLHGLRWQLVMRCLCDSNCGWPASLDLLSTVQKADDTRIV